jgi:hypothetical protein
MIAAKYNKALIDREFISGLATETANDIYQVQQGITQTNKRSGKFYRYLQQRPFAVTNMGLGVRLTMSFLSGIRYADMKHSRSGKLKHNYTPIYNKIVWGFIYGYLYKQLMWGISKSVNEAVTNRLQAAGYKLK